MSRRSRRTSSLGIPQVCPCCEGEIEAGETLARDGTCRACCAAQYDEEQRFYLGSEDEEE